LLSSLSNSRPWQFLMLDIKSSSKRGRKNKVDNVKANDNQYQNYCVCPPTDWELQIHTCAINSFPVRIEGLLGGCKVSLGEKCEITDKYHKFLRLYTKRMSFSCNSISAWLLICKNEACECKVFLYIATQEYLLRSPVMFEGSKFTTNGTKS